MTTKTPPPSLPPATPAPAPFRPTAAGISSGLQTAAGVGLFLACTVGPLAVLAIGAGGGVLGGLLFLARGR